MDIPEKEEFSENYNLEISSLHALFDNYLQPNLGNNPEKTLEFFKNILLKNNNNNLYEKEIIILRNSLLFNYENLPKKVSIQYTINDPYDRDLKDLGKKKIIINNIYKI